MKRYAISFGLGLAAAIATILGFVVAVTIWNHTVNLPDRQWMVNEKVVSTQAFRAIVNQINQESPRRTIAQMCANPAQAKDGISGIVHDEALGAKAQLVASKYLDHGPGYEEPSFADELACNAIFPASFSTGEYIAFVLLGGYKQLL